MMKDTSTTFEQTWDTIAESFDVTRRKPWKQCLDFIQEHPKNAVVADLGCGNGRHLLPCAEHCTYVIGIDISRNLLKIAEKKTFEKNLLNVLFLQGNLVNIPLKDNTLDTVLYIASLHNIKGKEERIRSLREVKRILKKDGRALISVWSRWQDAYRMQFFKRLLFTMNGEEFGDIEINWRQHKLNIPRFYHLYSKRELIQNINQSGLQIEHIQSVKFHSKLTPDNYFVLTRKTHS
jgi:alkylated DNA repair protein alkB family protein 8